MAADKTPKQPHEERSIAATVVSQLAATATIAKVIVDARKPKK